MKPCCLPLFLLTFGALGLGLLANVPETALAQAVSTYERQPAVADFDQTVGMPPYIFRAYQFAAETPGRFRVEVYIGMVNDILQFVKASSDSGDEGGHTAAGYRAQYEMNVTIWDKQNNLIDSRNWKRELVVGSFNETNDRKKLNLERAAFDLPPGEYDLALEITDRDTGKNLREKRPLKLAEGDDQQLRVSSIAFTEPFSVSLAAGETNPAAALAVWKNLPRAARRDSLRYNLTAILTNWARAEAGADSQSADPRGTIAAGAYFEIYGAAAGETLQLQYEIRDWRQQVEHAWEENVPVTQTPLCHLAVLADRINQPGLHTLRVVAKPFGRSPASKKEATAEESFQVQVSANPDYAAALAANRAMLHEPLRYILKSAEYKRMADAAEAARDSLVADFWRQRDPDPETPANQLREEFYRRVAFSDMRFAAAGAGKAGEKKLAGWETDRGRIYIKYGPPKEVHHQMAEQGSPPYEVWFYPNLDLYFVFRDKTGSGDYELVNR